MITAEFINDVVKFSCDHKKWSHCITSNRLHNGNALTIDVCFTSSDLKRQTCFSQIIDPTDSGERDIVTLGETLKIIKGTLDVHKEIK